MSHRKAASAMCCQDHWVLAILCWLNELTIQLNGFHQILDHWENDPCHHQLAHQKLGMLSTKNGGNNGNILPI